MLALAEGTLRVIGFEYANFFQPDPLLGHAHRPGAEGWWRREGEARVVIDAHGLRDRPHVPSRPGATFRIALLGDSYAEAMQVADSDGISTVMERALEQCPALEARSVEVLNFGVAGYSTAQQLLQLRDRVLPHFDAHLIALLFTSGNDVRDNLKELANEPDMRPFYVLEQDGTLRIDDSFRESKAWRLRSHTAVEALYGALDHSRLLQAAQRARHRWKIRQQSATRRNADISSTAAANTDSPSARRSAPPPAPPTVYAPGNDSQWAEAWSLTEALLSQIHRETEAAGLPFWLVLGSDPVQTHPPVARGIAARDQGSDYPEQRLEALARRESFPVVNLVPALRRTVVDQGTEVHGFPPLGLGTGHWNEHGHAIAGHTVADAICAALTAEEKR